MVRVLGVWLVRYTPALACEQEQMYCLVGKADEQISDSTI